MKKIRVIAEVETNDDFSVRAVRIGSDFQPLPQAVAIAATEHLMTMVAIDSKDGFERALELLVDGARSNKTLKNNGIAGQGTTIIT